MNTCTKLSLIQGSGNGKMGRKVVRAIGSAFSGRLCFLATLEPVPVQCYQHDHQNVR